MDDSPSLEGLRQALLLPNYRVKNHFNCPNTPYNRPELWIRSISILNTTLTTENIPLKIEFSPQLNTIIGGRGSGKSSVLRFIRGLFNRNIDLDELTEILLDHKNFYKQQDKKTKTGVLTDESKIEIEFVRDEVLHKITASGIINSDNQTITIERLTDSNWEIIQDYDYIDFFKFEHYSQKQIYEIAQKPNSLKDRIDKSIPGIESLKSQIKQQKQLFLEKSASIRTMTTSLAEKPKIETQIKDLDNKIKKFQESKVANILIDKKNYDSQMSLVKSFREEANTQIEELIKFSNSVGITDVEFSTFSDDDKTELASHTKEVVNEFNKIKSQITSLAQEANQKLKDFKDKIGKTTWLKSYEKSESDYKNKKREFEKDGINDLTSFESLSEEKKGLEDKIRTFSIEEENKVKYTEDLNSIKEQYTLLCEQVTTKRQEFLKNLEIGDKVQIKVKGFRNRSEFESRIKQLLGVEINRYQDDIKLLLDVCFNGKVEDKILEFKQMIRDIINGESISLSLGGNFLNKIKKIKDTQQLDEIYLIMPDDEIEVKYRPAGKSEFKPLSTASAGQKTTAILTFILSYGTIPLILDQPEDDLDNRLVYELVVDRLSESKERRQIIVVTHNANIPVNGDAEYIISMNSESKNIEVLYEGSVEKLEIKQEICDVMEGGKSAFEMRSKRYNLLN